MKEPPQRLYFPLHFVGAFLGLVVAIPTTLLHTIVSGRSRRVTQIIQEQGAGIIARHSEKHSS